MSNRDRCEACRYWQCLDRYEHDDVGRCRRHAPQTVKDSVDHTFRNWPCTFFDDWCGEYVDSGRRLEGEWETTVAEVAQKLNELGLPIDVSAPKAYRALHDAGDRHGLNMVRAAVKARRQQAEFIDKWTAIDVDPFG